MRGFSRVTRAPLGKGSIRITRPLTPVGPRRSVSMGVATENVRHWATAKPAKTNPQPTMSMSKAGRRRTRYPNPETAATAAGPSHNGGSSGRAK